MLDNHRYFYYLYFRQKKALHFNLGLSFFIWLFLSLAQPFGIYENNFSHPLYLVLFLIPFGFSWAVLSYAVDFIALYLISQEKLDYRRDFYITAFKLIAFIHTFFLIRSYYCGWQCYDAYEYLELWFAALLMFFLVYIPFSLYGRFLYFKSLVGQRDDSDSFFPLETSGKEIIRVNLSELVYFKSDDNYVDLVLYKGNDKIETSVLRITLSSISKQLENYPQFRRSHRSYIINLHYFLYWDEKQRLYLGRGSYNRPIPVSKKYQEEIKALVK